MSKKSETVTTPAGNNVVIKDGGTGVNVQRTERGGIYANCDTRETAKEVIKSGEIDKQIKGK